MAVVNPNRLDEMIQKWLSSEKPGPEEVYRSDAVVAKERGAVTEENDDFVFELFEAYFGSTEEKIALMRDAGRERRLGELRASAEDLRMESINIGALEIAMRCKQIENLEEAGDDAEMILGELEDALRSFREGIGK